MESYDGAAQLLHRRSDCALRQVIHQRDTASVKNTSRFGNTGQWCACDLVLGIGAAVLGRSISRIGQEANFQ